MTRFARAAAAAASLALVAGCTSNQVGVAPPVAAADVAATATLQFAVGSAHVGLSGGGALVALNTVETFRQSDGLTATLANYPVLSGPYFPGKAHRLFTERPDDIAANDAEIARGIDPTNTTLAKRDGDLGPFFQATGYGFGISNRLVTTPSDGCTGVINVVANGPRDATVNQPVFLYVSQGPLGNTSLCERGVTPFGGTGATPSAARYFGASPLWPSPTGYNQPAYFRGYPLGFLVFTNYGTSPDTRSAPPPIAGAYGLDVAYPADASATTYGHATATATLVPAAITRPLPIASPPTLSPQPDGSAFVNVTIPSDSRIVESIVEIETDYCDSADLIAQGMTNQGPPNHYSFAIYRTGPQTLLVPSDLGAPPFSYGMVPTHSFCTYGDDKAAALASSIPLGPVGPPHNYTVTVVSFDYPAFEASYPKNLSTRPAITSGDGHTGTADLSISAPTMGHYATSAGN